MRIIEPVAYKNRAARQKNFWRRLSVKRWVLLMAGVLVSAGAILLLLPGSLQAPSSSPAQPAANRPVPTTPPPKPRQLQQFSGQQFMDLYEKVVYPNTQPIVEPPVITGNPAADERIRRLAAERGYRLRAVPVAPIAKIGDPNLSEDDLLQQKALDGWRQLQAAAQKDGLPLRILSGYRSPSLQRQIFVKRLAGYGVNDKQVAAGQADAAVLDLLKTTSIPGYSRHHTGYTVDFQCSSGSLEAFKNSACYRWISANNYAAAKAAGWIPSYPEGARLQGPEPEPWEFVWVGTELLYR